MEAFRKLVSGEAKAKVVVADESTKAAAEAFRDTSDAVEDAVVETPEAQEVIEQDAVVETVVEEVVAEAQEVETPSEETTTEAEEVTEG